MYFDSHAHYDDGRYRADRDELLEGLPLRGVGFVVNIGADMRSSEKGIRLAEKYPYIYASVGVHPHSAKDMNAGDLVKMESWLKHPKVVAVGEIGLDFFHNYSPQDVQREWFKKQLAVAEAADVPVVIHSREAAQEVFDILCASTVRRGVIHCYAGSAEMAKEYVKMGFLIGVGGVVTFSKGRKLAEVVKELPIETILIETDCPYLTPEPYRDKRNDSSYLKFIVEKIADIKGMRSEDVASITTENALALYQIKKG